MSERHNHVPFAGSQAGLQPTASHTNELGEVAKTIVETRSNGGGSGGGGNAKTYGVQTSLGSIVLTESDSGVIISMDNAKAQFEIAESGHVTIKSSSGSGVSVQASSGTVGVEGVDVVVKSSGNLQLDSGGDLNLNSKGGINLTTPTGSVRMNAQSLEQNINGLMMINATKEMNMIVGGHMRMTVAGDHRLQVSGNTSIDAEGAAKIRSTGELTMNSKAKLNIISEGDMGIHVAGGLLKLRTSGNLEVDTGGNEVHKTSDFEVNVNGNSTIKASGNSVVSGSTAKLIGSSTAKVTASNVNLDASNIEIMASNKKIAGGTTDVDIITPGASGSASVDSPGSPSSAESPQKPEKAQTLKPEMVQDELSTLRKAPEYPYNAKRRTSAGGSRMRNKGAGGSGKPSGSGYGAPQDTNSPAPWGSGKPSDYNYTGDPASVVYNNGGAIRNQKLSSSLEGKIGDAVGAVYGPGSKAVVYSGGQSGSRRTGSVRHDNGHAADIYVYRPDGSQVVGSDLANLGQYWLANDMGSVGLEMNGGGIHLDEWGSSTGSPLGSGMGEYWFYGGESAEQINKIKQGASGANPEGLASTEDGTEDDSAKKILPEDSEAKAEIEKNKGAEDYDIEELG